MPRTKRDGELNSRSARAILPTRHGPIGSRRIAVCRFDIERVSAVRCGLRKMIVAGALAMRLAGCVSADEGEMIRAVESYGFTDVEVWDEGPTGCFLGTCSAAFSATNAAGKKVSGYVNIMLGTVDLKTTPELRTRPDSQPRQVGVPQ